MFKQAYRSARRVKRGAAYQSECRPEAVRSALTRLPLSPPLLAAGDAPGFMNAVALATRPAPPRTAAKRKDPAGGKSGGFEPPAEQSEPESAFARLLARFSRR